MLFEERLIWISTINIVLNIAPIFSRKHKRGFLNDNLFEIEKGEILKKSMTTILSGRCEIQMWTSDIDAKWLCQTIFCDENEECVLLADTSIAKCICKDSCPKFTSALDKVCTKDGQTFDNVCSMNLASCRKKQKLVPVDCEKLASHRTVMVTISMVDDTSTSAPITTKNVGKTEDCVGTIETQHNQLIQIHRLPLDVQYQIFCDLPSPTWQRRSTPIEKFLPFESNLRLSDDKRMLYLTPASFFHNGNFTCKSGEMLQIHKVKVENLEKLELKPSFIMVTSDQPVVLTCVTTSNYKPGRSIFWFRNDQMIPNATNKSSLELKKTELKDTGSYRCEITSDSNDKKIQSNAASVVVREMFDNAEKFYQSMKSFSTPQKTLVTFGQDGIEFYDQTDNCTLLKLIPAYLPVTKFKSGFLCGPKKMCSWDQVVKLPKSKIFATLRNRKLLFRLDTNDLEIDTMSYLNFLPRKMIYNQRFDTIWIHGLDKGRGQLYFLSKVSTLNDSRFRPQLSTNAKLNVSRIFIPSNENFTHGYLIGKNDPFKLLKIDLTNGRMVNNNNIDLKFYECVPDQVIFVEQRSMIIINCDEHHHSPFSTNLFKTNRLFIDYLTDEVIDVSRMIRGRSKLTPDHRFLFTYDKHGEKMFVEQLQDGKDHPDLINTFDLAVSADSWLIYPDSNFGQWLLYALSSDGTYLLKFDFRIMKLDILKHFEKSKRYQNRLFQFNDVDSDLLMISSSELYQRVKISSIKNIHHSLMCSLSRPVGVKFAFIF